MPLQWLLNTKLKRVGVSWRNFLLFYKMKASYILALLFFPLLCFIVFFFVCFTLLVLFFFCVSCSLCITIFFHVLMFHYSHALLLLCFATHVLHYSCMFILLVALVFHYSYMFFLPCCSYALVFLWFDVFVCFAITWCFVTLMIHCSCVLWYDIVFHYSCVLLFLRSSLLHCPNWY